MKVRIGPHLVRVLYDRKTTLDLAKEGKYGDSDVGALTIRVRGDLPDSVWQETLCHEVLHHIVALTHLATRWPEQEEEEIIRALSPYLSSVVWPDPPRRK